MYPELRDLRCGEVLHPRVVQLFEIKSVHSMYPEFDKFPRSKVVPQILRLLNEIGLHAVDSQLSNLTCCQPAVTRVLQTLQIVWAHSVDSQLHQVCRPRLQSIAL